MIRHLEVEFAGRRKRQERDPIKSGFVFDFGSCSFYLKATLPPIQAEYTDSECVG